MSALLLGRLSHRLQQLVYIPDTMLQPSTLARGALTALADTVPTFKQGHPC